MTTGQGQIPTHQVEIPTQQECRDCFGLGWRPISSCNCEDCGNGEAEKCPTCHGTGSCDDNSF
jgi:hypothetical protein